MGVINSNHAYKCSHFYIQLSHKSTPFEVMAYPRGFSMTGEQCRTKMEKESGISVAKRQEGRERSGMLSAKTSGHFGGRHGTQY